MVHDFALTSGHVIFMDLPVVFDLGSAMAGVSIPFCWSDSYGARLGILPRGAGIDKLRWVEVDPCYVYHVANAFETPDGTITLDVARYKEHFRGGPPSHSYSFDTAVLTRWTIAPGASKAQEQQLDDRTIEFPKIDDSRTGQRHDTVYALATHGTLATGVFTELLKYDLKSGRVDSQDFDGLGVPSEFTMVSAGPDSRDDEGWLLGFVYDRTRDASDLVIFDAQSITGDPVAKIRLPRRVPQGFHGSWIADKPAQNGTHQPALELIAPAASGTPAIKTTRQTLLFGVIPRLFRRPGRRPLRLIAESAMEKARVLRSPMYNRDANRGMTSKWSAIQAQGLDYEDRISGCHSCTHRGFPECGKCCGSVRRACLRSSDRSNSPGFANAQQGKRKALPGAAPFHSESTGLDRGAEGRQGRLRDGRQQARNVQR